MILEISDSVHEKLTNKHNVSELEIIECLTNFTGRFFVDRRTEHQSVPPTQWFIGETDNGRVLKIVFMQMSAMTYRIKSAYPPDEEWSYD